MAETERKNFKKGKNKMKQKLLLLFFISYLFYVSLSFGQEDAFNTIKNKSIGIISNIIRFAFSILMLGGSMLLIFLGIKYMFAKEKVGELHKVLLYLIIGIILLITSFFIPNFIKNFIESSIR